jgi:hypothetical protein
MHRWLLVMLLFSGCAFGISGPDPDRPRNQMPRCDSGKGLVALDGAMAATAGLVALSLAGETEPAVALLPLSIAAIYTAGAIRGNRNANKCREAMSDFESFVAARDAIASPPASTPYDDELPPPKARPVASRSDAAPAVQPAPSPAPAPAPTSAPPPAQAAVPAAAAKPASKPAPAPEQQPAEDWADFWREVE